MQYLVRTAQFLDAAATFVSMNWEEVGRAGEGGHQKV